MNAQIKSRIIATLAATLAALVGNQLLSFPFASIQTSRLIDTGLMLTLIVIGAVVLKVLQKNTPLWAALAANVFAFFVIYRLFASGNFVPSSRSLVFYIAAMIVSYWLAQFAALSAIDFIAPRMRTVKHDS